MDEVTGPIVAVGLVLCAVFVPCAFISGITGLFFQPICPVTIAVSTVISAINAVTMTSFASGADIPGAKKASMGTNTIVKRCLGGYSSWWAALISYLPAPRFPRRTKRLTGPTRTLTRLRSTLNAIDVLDGDRLLHCSGRRRWRSVWLAHHPPVECGTRRVLSRLSTMCLMSLSGAYAGGDRLVRCDSVMVVLAIYVGLLVMTYSRVQEGRPPDSFLSKIRQAHCQHTAS